MLKLAGAGLLLLAGVLGAWDAVSRQRKQLRLLRRLITVLSEMEEEIRLTRTPLPRLLKKLAENDRTECGRFLTHTADSLCSGQPPEHAFREGAEMLPLPQELCGSIAEIGESFRGDEEQICKAISLFRHRFEQTEQDWHRQQTNREKRSAALFLSASAMLVILLI